MGKMKVQVVEETPYGVYVWQMPDGSLVCDEDRRYLCVPAVKGDFKRINELKMVAKHYGLVGGQPVWMGGHRPISDSEYDHQRERLEWGLVPDEWDLPALKEDMEQKRKMKIV